MTSDISIKLEPDPDGLPISGGSSNFASLLNDITVTGATISYGYNKIPIANVHIAPVGANRVTGLASLCDFDSFRRNPVKLIISTRNDCIVFRGIIDGNSISQQPGNMMTSFIVKSNFTILNEVYPRLIGGNASTINKFAIAQDIGIDSTSSSQPVDNSNIQQNYPFYSSTSQIFNHNISLNVQAIQFLINLCQIIVDSQRTNSGLLVGSTETSLGNFSQLVCALGLNVQSDYEIITTLISAMDASFTYGFTAEATDALIGNKIQNSISQLEDTMFRGLVRVLEDFGCVLVVANNKLFIVPNAPYLKPSLSASLPGIAQQSIIPNVAYPADYENFNFQDLGENSIKGVFVVAEPMTNSVDMVTGSGALNMNGLFTEDLNIQSCVTNNNDPISPSTGNNPANNNKVFGNIALITVPGIVTGFMTAATYRKSYGVRNIITNGNIQPGSINISMAPNNPVSAEEATDAIINAHSEDASYIKRMQNYLHNIAQIEYCKIKYGDRTGSINMPYNNNWVPGAPGSLYTRSPGIRIDFFVTDVTHNFSIAAPNQGNATTNITFTGGRPGASINVGLDQIDLFQYTYDSGPYNSIDFCKAFLNDISH